MNLHYSKSSSEGAITYKYSLLATFPLITLSGTITYCHLSTIHFYVALMHSPIGTTRYLSLPPFTPLGPTGPTSLSNFAGSHSKVTTYLFPLYPLPRLIPLGTTGYLPTSHLPRYFLSPLYISPPHLFPLGTIHCLQYNLLHDTLKDVHRIQHLCRITDYKHFHGATGCLPLPYPGAALWAASTASRMSFRLPSPT